MSWFYVQLWDLDIENASDMPPHNFVLQISYWSSLVGGRILAGIVEETLK